MKSTYKKYKHNPYDTGNYIENLKLHLWPKVRREPYFNPQAKYDHETELLSQRWMPNAIIINIPYEGSENSFSIKDISVRHDQGEAGKPGIH